MKPSTLQSLWSHYWRRPALRRSLLNVSLAAALSGVGVSPTTTYGKPPATPARRAVPAAKRRPVARGYLPLEGWKAAQAAPRPNYAGSTNPTDVRPRQNAPGVAPSAPPAAANTVDIIRPSGYVATTDQRPTATASFRQDENVSGDRESAVERLPDMPADRVPGSRTQAETVDAPPSVPVSGDSFEIDLPTVLRLILTANPNVANARELVRETLALQTKARVMLLPSLNAGVTYHRHLGNFQASTGQIKDISSQSVYYGGGSRVWAAESLAVPMVRIFSHLGDAIYEPLSVRQQVSMRQFDSTATANTLLLQGIILYFDLLGAEGRLEGARQTERETAEIVRITASYAKTGQGREGDANRARTEAYLMHTEVQRAEERVAIASGRLAEILSLDPSVRLKTVGGPISGLEIIDQDADLPMLIRMAERRRPELMSASANIQHNATKLRQEKVRPLFPMVMMGYSSGSFGGGSVLFPPKMGNFRGRQDFDVLAVWSLANMGVGNMATVAERRAVLNQSFAERSLALNGIRQEVIAAYGLVKGEQTQIQITQRQLSDSEQGFREEFARLLGAEALPIEVLNSVDQLGVARQELIKAVTNYNQAQFRLFVATGSSPTRANLPAREQPNQEAVAGTAQ
jgi:outer membrane protein TolC